MIRRSFVPAVEDAINNHSFRLSRPLNITSSGNLTAQFTAPARAVAGLDELAGLPDDELDAHPGVSLSVFMKGTPRWSNDNFDITSGYLTGLSVTDYGRAGGWFFFVDRIALVSVEAKNHPEKMDDPAFAAENTLVLTAENTDGTH